MEVFLWSSFISGLTEVLDTLLGRYLLSCEKRKDHLWHKVSLFQQYVHSMIPSISVDKKGQQLEEKKKCWKERKLLRRVLFIVSYIYSPTNKWYLLPNQSKRPKSMTSQQCKWYLLPNQSKRPKSMTSQQCNGVFFLTNQNVPNLWHHNIPLHTDIVLFLKILLADGVPLPSAVDETQEL